MDMAINLESVEIGQTVNHLLFKGYVPRFSNSKKYEFDFTGTELTSTCGLLEKQIKSLVKKLVEDYGYAPYDEKVAKQILGDGKQYKIKM